MKYFEVDFIISPYSIDASDLLAALAGEAGFETFEETEQGLKGYVQQSLFSKESLIEAIRDFPIEGTNISYTLKEAENRDWNETWEQEGFEPIFVSDKLVIHDGRHLPFNLPEISVEIDAKLSFGTGNHETTRMICSTLLELPLKEKRVLDCGTGTGILAICSLLLGAKEAIGYDIDEWSIDNARHNAINNFVDSRFQQILGDASVLAKVQGNFDLILANINRNILISDLPVFRSKMSKEAMLILSGFYAEDCNILISKAKEVGLTMSKYKEDKGWACLVFSISA